MKEIGQQIAALPLRRGKDGKLRVLLVTSRDTGRWVLPKGWMIDGLKPWEAAAVEALDEAGADGRVSPKVIGTYHYDKMLDDGSHIVCGVQVFPMQVAKLKRTWKERRERERRWFSAKAAARRVDEGELAELLRGLEKRSELKPVFKELGIGSG